MSPKTAYNDNEDIILDLEIPFYVYIMIFCIIIIILILNYVNPKEGIFDFIEKSKQNSLSQFSSKENKLDLLTKLNTKINRDYLDHSKYYFEKGYNKIYEINKSSIKDNNKDSEKEKKEKEKIFIKKNKKVGFSNNIIYENEF